MRRSASLRTLGVGALAALLLSAGLTAPSAASPDQRRASSPRTTDWHGPAERAAAAARTYVAHRPAPLHGSRRDAYRQLRPLVTSAGLVYVPYLRLFRGLPVVGGDFVVVTDTDGTVLEASVAQDRPVRLPTTRPVVAPSRAADIVRRTLTGGRGRTTRPELVVLQDRGSHLAYESTVSVRHDLRVRAYVDATTGTLLRQDELVVHGRGRPAYSGPTPVRLHTTRLSSRFALRDPTHAGLACGHLGRAGPLTGTDDSWGNGVARNKETGCVDALFAAQEQQRMLEHWLGRRGVKASGGSYPIKVGLDAVDAYFDHRKVVVGHNGAGQWLSAIDVVAHELGHGVDANTPGGISWNGTTEFIADSFATMTEFYSDQDQAFDGPDYTIGEEVDMFGEGPVRYMYRPSRVGQPNCYTSRVPGMEMHAAAGPGDHWFFLAAEGSTGATGRAVSPTCNRTQVTGIGIRLVSEILYHAMLMKTSAASYLTYRTWTLTAAKRLHPGSCVEFNTILAAWNAVSVPRQRNEPTC